MNAAAAHRTTTAPSSSAAVAADIPGMDGRYPAGAARGSRRRARPVRSPGRSAGAGGRQPEVPAAERGSTFAT
ncbi:hypothetical protein GCM10009802_25570 [Streptomyces synnematoformans]|uniref:Uncharacterized protein n=1 Tax=Streptomyces synnematoformans TaxID=415721 RepID=A0ABN2Y7E0_9ACTN